MRTDHKKPSSGFQTKLKQTTRRSKKMGKGVGGGGGMLATLGARAGGGVGAEEE